jgi:acyl-CoA reductase-like NAD-dependent aldehyde dehydrogenase
MFHLPLLRYGRPYRSVDVAVATHYRTGEPFVRVSQANTGLIMRDLLKQSVARAALAAVPARELVAISRRAAKAFLDDTLPLDAEAGVEQRPADYVEHVTATTGLPHVMVRRNMQKIAGVLGRVEEVLAGLTRGLDLALLDDGVGEAGGRILSFFPRTLSLGVVLPSNSPGVHSLWVPAIALKTPLVLRPGSAEPWTPWRLAQAFMRAGCPPEAFCYYPSDHAGGTEILRACGRGIMFGDASSLARWAHDSRIERHGPGYSKIVIAADAIDRWREYLDVLASSIVENGGRSCINASGIWVTSRADEIAEALAVRLARIEPRAEDDERAQIAPFADPRVAERISALVDEGLAERGARDVTEALRGSGRLARVNGCTYLLPTIVRCDPEHVLANREFLFPFASVVQTDEAALPDVCGPTLVMTAITSNQALIDRLVASPLVDRLNLGPIPTMQIVWDQPHEGNLFEHLYGRRAIQKTA